MLPPGAIFELKIHQNAYSAESGKLTELPDPLAGFQGAAKRQGREESGGEGREGGKGRGSVPPLYNLTTAQQ